MFSVNDAVTNRYEVAGDTIGGNYSGTWQRVAPGTPGRVTRVGTNSVVVRWYPENRDPFSFWVDTTLLEDREDFEATAAPKRRKLGHKPEGDEYLDPRDPRLEWFWDDVTEYTQPRYCGTLDEILKGLDLPARKQKFNVTADLNGMTISGQVLARTQAEASKKFADSIVEAVQAAASELANGNEAATE